MTEPNKAFFVVGLEHSGTSIVQKTLADQNGFTTECLANGNLGEHAPYDDYSSGQVYKFAVSNFDRPPNLAFKWLHTKYGKCAMQIIFMERDAIEWACSRVKRQLSEKQHDLDINELKLYGENAKEYIEKSYNLYKEYGNKKNEVKDFCDNNDLNISYVDLKLVDFAKNPKRFLEKIGFKNPLIENRNNDRNINLAREKNDHELLRINQINASPNPNLIRSNFDFHPTVKDFIEKIFK